MNMNVLMPNETEMYVETMKPQRIRNIGSPLWLEWHKRLQKLNQQALIEARALREEHVKETLVSFNKITVLVHEAITVNIWKYKILPHLLELEPNPTSSIVAYTVLYHEAVCVALLELIMYHSNCAESLEDSALDLLDYICGTAGQLLSIHYRDEQLNENVPKEILRHRNNLSFDIGIRSLTIIRYIAENLNKLPLCVMNRLYSGSDIPVLFCQILIAAPWLRSGKVYIGGEWKNWDFEQLVQTEAQVWLTLNYLLLDAECTKQYTITDGRKNQLVKLLPKMRPTLLDQLSSLIGLKQWLCRLSMMEQSAIAPNPILLEPVLEIKGRILQQVNGKWEQIAKEQLELIFCRNKLAIQETAMNLSEAYNADLLEQHKTPQSFTTCEQCGKHAIQRCSRCKKAWYCSRMCQVNNWPQHKENCSN